MIDLERTVSQQQFGRIVGVSQPTISDFLTRGILTEGETLGSWLIAYCGHLREQAAGRRADGDLDLATERAALARAQRERIEMQNAVTRREFTPTIVIEQVLVGTAAKIAGIFDAIPGMIRRRLPHMTVDEIDLIAAEVAKARNAVAAMPTEGLLRELGLDGGERSDPAEEGDTSQPEGNHEEV